MEPNLEFVRLSPDEWEKAKEFRIRAVTDQPRAFGSTPEEDNEIPEEEWRRRLTEKSSLYAQEEGKLLGTVAVVPEKDTKSRHIANIWSVYVVPESRGKGIARELLTRAMRAAVETHPDLVKFRLTVTVTQQEALKLYESLGFERVGLFKKELLANGEFIDEIVMEKYLS